VSIDFFIGINKPNRFRFTAFIMFSMLKKKLICTKNSFKKYIVQMQSYGMREKEYKKKEVHNLAIVRCIDYSELLQSNHIVFFLPEV